MANLIIWLKLLFMESATAFCSFSEVAIRLLMPSICTTDSEIVVNEELANLVFSIQFSPLF